MPSPSASRKLKAHFVKYDRQSEFFQNGHGFYMNKLKPHIETERFLMISLNKRRF